MAGKRFKEQPSKINVIKNSKLIISLIALLISALLATGNSFALFSDYVSSIASLVTGNVSISITNAKIGKSGDELVSNVEPVSPFVIGEVYTFQYTVNNTGTSNESIDTTMKIAWDVDSDLNEADVIYLYPAGLDDSDIIADIVSGDASNAIISYNNSDKITYVMSNETRTGFELNLNPFVLASGTGVDASQNFEYKIVFGIRPGVTTPLSYFDKFAGQNLKIEVDCSAKTQDSSSFWNDKESTTFMLNDAQIDSDAPILDALKKAPIITIDQEEVSMLQDDYYNVLTGITADDGDGNDITSDIVVTGVDEDGNDITNKIDSEGNLDTSALGIYTITYTVTNSYGEQATAVKTITIVPMPVLTKITAVEGQTATNTIDLTPTYIGSANKLYYVAVDSASGYVPTDSADLIDFVLNGTDDGLTNTDYTGAHVARGVVDLNGSGGVVTITGLDMALSNNSSISQVNPGIIDLGSLRKLQVDSDAGLVGGVKYQIYAVVVNDAVENAISNMADLGYYQLAQGFDSGFGSSSAPYEISSDVSLSHMNYPVYNTNANLNYILTADIDLSGYSSDSGWTPIGDTTTPFVGTFDGQNHIISDLTIDNATATVVGLFGTSTGTIKNVGIDSGSVKSTNTVETKIGGLVGYLSGGTVDNCYSDADVVSATGKDGSSGVGGLIGTAYGTSSGHSVITNSYATGTVSGMQDAGGFIGDVEATAAHASPYVDISKCYSTGDVSISGALAYQVGGFVGRTNGTTTILDCYASGNVSSTSTYSIERIGGFVGWTQDSTGIAYCYASGNVMSTNASTTNQNSGVGGFVGSTTTITTPKAYIRNCLAFGNVLVGGAVKSDASLNARTGKFIGLNNGSNPTLLSNNYVNAAITTNGTTSPATTTEMALTGLETASFYTTATNWFSIAAITHTQAWDTTIWNIVDGQLPTLK
ncbi:MAG: DUF5011 domain-containing protein [Oscillospiraceae bacterium]|nr:DUF5011 domain-containing protein [Oscillospiraceae bacterium]